MPDTTGPPTANQPTRLETQLPRRLDKAAAAASSLVFLAGVGVFAYTGTFSRLWADDYCYSAVMKVGGLWGGVVDWYLTSGNRLSSAALAGVSDRFGPAAVSVLPFLFLTLLTAAWLFFLFQLRRMARWQFGAHWLILFALMQVYFLALLSPDRLQTVYWRMGMLHYSLPLPLLLAQLGLVARYVNAPGRLPVWVFAATFLLALFAAGNSETFAFLQLGLWGLALAALLLMPRFPLRARLAVLAASPLAGTAAALAVMFFSPQNADRLAVMPPPDNLWLTIPVTLRHTADFVFYAIRGQLTPFLVFLAVSAAVAVLSLREGPLLPFKRGLSAAAITLPVTLALVASSFFPSSYAGLQYPSGRALMPGAFVLLAGASFLVFFLANTLRFLVRPTQMRWFAVAALLLLFAASLYPLWAVQFQAQEQRRLSTWAARWDDRDRQIRQSLAAGAQDLQVREIEVVQSLEDMGPNADFWINRCAAVYYGAKSITANP
jgi:hypothetical protein